jgi:hypothetical protein
LLLLFELFYRSIHALTIHQLYAINLTQHSLSPTTHLNQLTHHLAAATMILPRTHHSSPSPSTHLQQLTIHLVSAAMFLSRSILALIKIGRAHV